MAVSVNGGIILTGFSIINIYKPSILWIPHLIYGTANMIIQYYTIWYISIYSQIIPTPRGQGTAEWKARRAMCGGVQCAAIVEKKPVVSVWMGSEKHAERFGMHTYDHHMIPFVTFMFGISKETGNEVVLLTTLMWAALQKDLAKFLWFFHAFQTLRHRVPPTQAMSAAMLIHVDSFSWHFAAFCSVLRPWCHQASGLYSLPWLQPMADLVPDPSHGAQSLRCRWSFFMLSSQSQSKSCQ